MKKRPLLLASLALVLSLTGCAKQVTAKEAKKHVEDNYSLEKANQVYGSTCTMKLVTNVKKSTGYFEKLFPVGEKKEETSVSITVIPAIDIVESDAYSYSLKGKGLIITYSQSTDEVLKNMGILVPENSETNGNVTTTMEYNEYGCPVSLSVNTKINYKFTIINETKEGSFESIATTTWTYTKVS